MGEIEKLKWMIREFAVKRDWEKFHTPKNLAMAVSGEAGELLAEFQWMTPEESGNLNTEQRKAIELEIADVAIYLLRLVDVLEVDIASVIEKKLKINESRFRPN